MKLRRFLSLVLGLVMVLSLVPTAAMAAEAGVTVTEVTSRKYNWIGEFSEGMAAVKGATGEETKWGPVYRYGFINETGQEVVPCKYSGVEAFSEGMAAVSILSKVPGMYGFAETVTKWGFIDKTGKEIVPCQYDKVNDFSEGMAAVCLDGKWGFIDKTGQEVVPCKYSGVEAFSEGLAWVMGSEDSGYIDKTGNLVISCKGKYYYWQEFSGGLAQVCTSINEEAHRWGYIDKTGKEVIPCKYYHMEGFTDGVLRVETNEGVCLLDQTGREIVPCGKYQFIDDFSEGLAMVKQPTGERDKWGAIYKYGYIDKTGKEVISCKYDMAEKFVNGMAKVCEGKGDAAKWGFVDTTGRQVVPCKYYMAWNFHEGMAGVGVYTDEKDQWGKAIRKYGFVDTTGKEAVPCQYTSVRSFFDGLAYVTKDNKTLFIDKTGKEVFSCDYDDVENFRDGVAIVYIDGEMMEEFGCIDKTGKEVIPCRYQALEYCGDGLIKTQSFFGEWSLFSARSTVPTIVSTGILPEANGIAHANTQNINVDGKAVKFDTYVLADANGGLTNYVKLRDLANALDGTAAQFNVVWTKETGVGVETGKPYTSRNGQEGKTPYTGDRPYVKGEPTTAVDGVALELQAFVLTDDNGGSSTYYQFRDLGQALGFNVGWSADKGVFIETDKPYDPAN